MLRRFPHGSAFTGMVSVFVLGWIGLPCGVAKAGLLYNQPAQFPTSSFNAWTSTFDPVSRGSIFTVYDNFSLTSTATVNDLTWQGFAFNSTTNGPTTSPVQGFNIGFYANSSGVPGSTPLYYTTAISFAEILAGTTDFFGNGQREAIYNYSATLPLGGFTAMAGTTYWLSIQGVIDSPAYWAWTSGTGGDGQSYQAPGGFRAGDRAFSLSGVTLGQNPIPEPSTLLMAGLGALAVIGYTSRARRRGAD